MSQPPERVREVALPPAARALSTFGRIDYHDAFLVQAGRDHDRTAGQWARVMLEEAPARLGLRGRAGAGADEVDDDGLGPAIGAG